MRYLVDTNVVLRWAQADSPEHAACSEAVDRLLETGHDPCICAQVMIEFWVVATRPVEVNGFGLSSDDAAARLADLLEVLTRLPEPADIADRWSELVLDSKAMGKQAHDTRLAALMLAHGVTHLLTLNPTDFSRYEGITPVTPAEVLAS